MSADSWKRCPICHNRPEKYPDGIEHLYGKLPLEEFLELDKELKQCAGTETVRLDYNVTIEDDGTAFFWLSAKCSACGTEWNSITKDHRSCDFLSYPANHCACNHPLVEQPEQTECNMDICPIRGK